MSHRAPATVVRMLFEARAAGDMRRVRALVDPDVPEVRRLFGFARAEGPRVEVDAHRVEVLCDERVAVHGRIRVIDGGSLSDSPAAWTFTVRHGRVTAITPLAPARPALRRVA